MKKDGKATCSFNLVNGFFTAFFNGFKELESESEARAAIANLGVVQVRSKCIDFCETFVDSNGQVIRQSNSDGIYSHVETYPPLVCISYEFIPSSGQVDSGTEEIFRVRDLGLLD